jgi:hypothetical protein
MAPASFVCPLERDINPCGIASRSAAIGCNDWANYDPLALEYRMSRTIRQKPLSVGREIDLKIFSIA